MTALDQHQKALVKLIEHTARRYRRHEVFRDFCELFALAISNTVDKHRFEEREKRYMELVKRYDRDDLSAFPQMCAYLTMSLSDDPKDALGQVFMSMEFSDDWRGQFFTPYEVAKLMARITLTDVVSIIQEKGYIALNEPAVGAGCMIIACADALREQGIDYVKSMHVTATDIDLTAVHMAYIQFTLLGIPAIVIHGDGLRPNDMRSLWFTPAHVHGGWTARLRPDEQEAA